VEVIESNRGNSSTDAGGDGLASISDKVRDGEDLFLGLFVALSDLKVPVVGELITRK